MKVTTPQKEFLANSENKARLIEKLMEHFQIRGLNVKQSIADADYLIVSTAMCTAQTKCLPVVVVATDTDLLVMLVSQATSDMDIYMLYGRQPLLLYYIAEIQTSFHIIKCHLMFIHATTGCDTVSALYNQGKKKALSLIMAPGNWNYLTIFSQADSTHDDIARVGESFLLKLYGAIRSESLDNHRYILYARSIRRAPLSSGFKLESLPPTTAAAKFHSFRAYHTIQQWQGHNLPPTEWGWHYREGLLVPIETDRARVR